MHKTIHKQKKITHKQNSQLTTPLEAGWMFSRGLSKVLSPLLLRIFLRVFKNMKTIATHKTQYELQY